MPFVSEAQRKLMYATAAGAKTGVPAKVAKEMVAKDEPGKLPKRAKTLDAVRRPQKKES